MVTLAFCVAALVLGIVMPKRWAVPGFVGGLSALFVAQVLVHAATGFAGASIEESLLLFNGSWLSYLGFNLQISYRSFAPVVFALALPLIFRLSR